MKPRTPLTWDERRVLEQAVALCEKQQALMTAIQEELVRVRAERDVLFVALGRKQMQHVPPVIIEPTEQLCIRCHRNPAKKQICSACKSEACRAAAFKRILQGKSPMFVPKEVGV